MSPQLQAASFHSPLSGVETFAQLAASTSFSGATALQQQASKIGTELALKTQPALEALSQLVSELKALRDSFAKAIRSALKRTISGFKPLENSLSSYLSKPLRSGFLGVAQRLFSRLTIHSQSSNSPPAQPAERVRLPLNAKQLHSYTERLKAIQS